MKTSNNSITISKSNKLLEILREIIYITEEFSSGNINSDSSTQDELTKVNASENATKGDPSIHSHQQISLLADRAIKLIVDENKQNEKTDSKIAGKSIIQKIVDPRLFFCIEQKPNPKELGLCSVTVTHNVIAYLKDANGKEVIRRMVRPQVEWIHATGFKITGYEEAGYTESGDPIYQPQEWLCKYSANLPLPYETLLDNMEKLNC